MKHVHVYPVPEGMTAEDAWTEIIIMGELVTAPSTHVWWAERMCDGQECSDVKRG